MDKLFLFEVAVIGEALSEAALIGIESNALLRANSFFSLDRTSFGLLRVQLLASAAHIHNRILF